MPEHNKPGQINLNTAALGELALTSVLGEQRARSLIDYRNSRGSIQGWEERNDIPGFTPDLIRGLKVEGFTI